MDENEILAQVTAVSSYALRGSSKLELSSASDGSEPFGVTDSPTAIKVEQQHTRLFQQQQQQQQQRQLSDQSQHHSSYQNQIGSSSNTSSTNSSASSISSFAEAKLEDPELWRTFNAQTNEMIVTKNGRRMFPVIKVSIKNLDPRGMYWIAIEFVQMESHKWRYVNGEWVAGTKSEPSSSKTLYVHPESPNFGAHWMKDCITFSKAKLTNKPNDQTGQVVLNSLHKYQPKIHIIRVGTDDKPYLGGKIETFQFTETQFIAVTAYQNESVTKLKIKFNPFAKAFQDGRDRPADVDLLSQHHHFQHSHVTRPLIGGVIDSTGPTGPAHHHAHQVFHHHQLTAAATANTKSNEAAAAAAAAHQLSLSSPLVVGHTYHHHHHHLNHHQNHNNHTHQWPTQYSQIAAAANVAQSHQQAEQQHQHQQLLVHTQQQSYNQTSQVNQQEQQLQLVHLDQESPVPSETPNLSSNTTGPASNKSISPPTSDEQQQRLQSQQPQAPEHQLLTVNQMLMEHHSHHHLHHQHQHNHQHQHQRQQASSTGHHHQYYYGAVSHNQTTNNLLLNHQQHQIQTNSNQQQHHQNHNHYQHIQPQQHQQLHHQQPQQNHQHQHIQQQQDSQQQAAGQQNWFV